MSFWRPGSRCADARIVVVVVAFERWMLGVAELAPRIVVMPLPLTAVVEEAMLDATADSKE